MIVASSQLSTELSNYLVNYLIMASIITYKIKPETMSKSVTVFILLLAVIAVIHMGPFYDPQINETNIAGFKELSIKKKLNEQNSTYSECSIIRHPINRHSIIRQVLMDN